MVLKCTMTSKMSYITILKFAGKSPYNVPDLCPVQKALSVAWNFRYSRKLKKNSFDQNNARYNRNSLDQNKKRSYIYEVRISTFNVHQKNIPYKFMFLLF